MRTARIVAMLALAFAGACSGGGSSAAKVGPSARPSGASGVPAAVKTTLPGRLTPPAPARLFAGSASGLGQLIHYCRDSTCADVAAHAPAYVTAPAGSYVLFSMYSTPLEAVAEVRTRPSETPVTVRLSPGYLMNFGQRLGSGRFLVDLVCRWGTSAARWRFGIILT